MRDIFMKENCRGGKNFIFITSLWFITLTYKAVQLNNLDFIIISFHWRPININSKRSHLSWSVIKTRGWPAHAPLETGWDKSPSPSLSIGGQAGCCEAGASSVLPLSSQHQRILPQPWPPLPLFSSYLKQYSRENLVGIKTIMTHWACFDFCTTWLAPWARRIN